MRPHKHHWKIVGSGLIFIWFDCRKCGKEENVARETIWPGKVHLRDLLYRDPQSA